MRPNPIYIVDILGDIVSKVSTIVTPEIKAFDANIVGVNYLYGPPKEIIATLTEMTKDDSESAKKYPLVALFQSFPEVKGKVGLDATISLRIIIARWNDITAKSKTRYQNNFKPVLYPVYLELLNQISFHGAFFNSQPNQIQHTKIDWPYWGGDNAEVKNPFNDAVDIIEIKDLKLNVNQNFCT